MATKVLRKIIEIDETKCNGCGACITSCAEGALALVDGKARLVKEKYCDGLAACLKQCPQDALHIIEREAEDFDEEATREHLEEKAARSIPHACPGSAVRQFEKPAVKSNASSTDQEPMLTHWPVQLTLVPQGVYILGNTSEPVCQIAVGLNRVGMVMLGGLNPLAAAVEAGIEVENMAESGLVDYSQLKSIWEL